MIDINPSHANDILYPFEEGHAEHYGYADQLYTLDFKIKQDIKFGLEKWLLPKIQWSNEERMLRKEALRYAITKYGGAYPSTDLSGLSVALGEVTEDLWEEKNRDFQLILWDELFHEPFVPADLSQYRERVDEGFVNRPWMPETWGEPEYKE